jgi:hypothetical protein
VCDEGLVAFEWPAKRYWRRVLRIGLRAGLAHAPSAVEGDAWPLSERVEFVESRSALLFPRETLAQVDVRRSRFWWNEVRVSELSGAHWVFTAADPRQIENYARRLELHFTVTRSGYWPAHTACSRQRE